MTVDTVLNHARAYVRNELVECSLAIDNGMIVKIGKETSMPEASVRIDLKNLLALPGLIDSHVHLRGEGKSYKEDFHSGTAAAAAGGFTTVLDMPNNEPVTMSTETLRKRMEKARKEILVNVGFLSEFPRKNDEIPAIVDQGAIAFKLFLANKVGGLNIDSDDDLTEAFKTAQETKSVVAIHAEDHVSIQKSVKAMQKDGRNGIEAYLEAHSEVAEEKAIERIAHISKKTGTHVHFCHVTTEKGLKAISQGKKSGFPLTCETTPHNLTLSTEDLRRIGTLALTMPPVREGHHIGALWRGINSGEIDTVGSDHAPHTIEEKAATTIWNVKVGIPGLETTIPLLLTKVNHGLLTLAEVVRLLCEKPAQIFSLGNRGYLGINNRADLTIADLKRKYKIDVSKFRSKAKYSPFDGWQVQGKPVKTFIAGQLVMDEGEIIGNAGVGEIVGRARH